jgi:Protein ENHANCED DISEASE RESISTANCE 2, C-terminal
VFDQVGSSTVASKIIGCCRGVSNRIDVQLGIVLQGEHIDELPERLLGAVQFSWLRVDDPAGQVPLFD